MGFLDKINYSIIVKSVKQVCKRGHCEVFFTNVRKLAHSSNMCFTVSGISQD